MILITCPHCDTLVYIEELNCCIFRHAVFKTTGEPIPPHTPRQVCDALLESGEIYGCAKPFQIVLEDGVHVPKVCDYI